MSNHLINDRFWDDSYIQDLNNEQKLLFVYLLSCPLNKYSGIFEISINMISFHTGIVKENLIKYLETYSNDKKIFYFKGWICINNYNKYNKVNPNIQKNIDEQLKLIPKEITKHFESIKEGLVKPSKALPKPAINSTRIESNNIVSNNIDIVNIVMQKFYEINPGLNFANKTQRKATEDLIKKFELEKLLSMLEWYFSKMEDKFCPVATTPLAFKEKIGDIKVFADKLKNNKIVTNLGNV